MITLPVTLITTAVLVLWYVYLSVAVSFARGAHQAVFGSGEPASALNRVVRIHGNAAEYIPLFLFVLALLEYHGLRVEILSVLTSVFVGGRLLHRSALRTGSTAKRIWAMQCTLWPLAIGACVLLYTWCAQVLLIG